MAHPAYAMWVTTGHFQLIKAVGLMRNQKHLVVIALTLVLCACGFPSALPVPADKLSYVGTWQTAGVRLDIRADGSIHYKRDSGVAQRTTTTSIDASLQRFTGNNFDVGFGPISTTFVVTKPPYREGDQWKMVVDGIELTRTAP